MLPMCHSQTRFIKRPSSQTGSISLLCDHPIAPKNNQNRKPNCRQFASSGTLAWNWAGDGRKSPLISLSISPVDWEKESNNGTQHEFWGGNTSDREMEMTTTPLCCLSSFYRTRPASTFPLPAPQRYEHSCILPTSLSRHASATATEYSRSLSLFSV